MFYLTVPGIIPVDDSVSLLLFDIRIHLQSFQRSWFALQPAFSKTMPRGISDGSVLHPSFCCSNFYYLFKFSPATAYAKDSSYVKTAVDKSADKANTEGTERFLCLDEA